MQSTDDLNAAADKQAELYDEVVLLTAEDLDLSNVADGGDPQSITYGAAGDEGPTSDTPAVDGIAWSDVVPFTLGEPATFVGLLRSGVLHYTEALSSPVGPGSVPFIHGIGPGAV